MSQKYNKKLKVYFINNTSYMYLIRFLDSTFLTYDIQSVPISNKLVRPSAGLAGFLKRQRLLMWDRNTFVSQCP